MTAGADGAARGEVTEVSFLTCAALRVAAVTTFTTTAFLVGDLCNALVASARARDETVGDVRELRFFVASIFWAFGERKVGAVNASVVVGLYFIKFG